MLLFVEQEKTNSVNIDDVIEEFKTLNDDKWFYNLLLNGLFFLEYLMF